MDAKLIAWARAVKARRGGAVPPLWVFTDRDRLPDPRAALAALPKGLCGVVLRPGSADLVLARDVARLCRQRRFVLAVSGQPRLAARLGARQHASRGWSPRPAGRGVVTASAHGRGELARARRIGASAVFLSPAFATPSHPGAGGLGVVRWAALARLAGAPVLALGGINGVTARRLPRFCAGAGVIGAVRSLVSAPSARSGLCSARSALHLAE